MRQIDVQDAEAEYAHTAEGDRGLGALHHIRSRTRSRTHEVVIGWEENDPENPNNWGFVCQESLRIKAVMLIANNVRSGRRALRH